jgi:hypothetical protein
MNKVLIAALALVAGCGGTRYHSGSAYSGSRTLPPDPPGVPSTTPDYLIDANAGADAGLTTYTITTNGLDWYLGWQGDAYAHSFTGNIYCPVGCNLSDIVFAPALPGDSINMIAANHVGFDAQTDANVRQTLQFTAPLTPVTFDLYIDGAPAVNPYTVFSSGGQLATTDIMPFNLVPSNALQEHNYDLAPLYKAPAGKDAKAFSLPAPAPRAGGVVTAGLKGAQ